MISVCQEYYKSNNSDAFYQCFSEDTFDEAYEYDESKKGPALDTYGTDITKLARQGKLDDCFGRDSELLEMMEILVRRQKNNPVLVGDAGVGKTAIIELFATKIVNNLVPFVLEGRVIVSLDLARIVAGSRYRGEFELRFQRVLDEVLAQPNIIIFIDEIHTLSGTGSAEGSLDAANILKPVLSRSGFQCIGATTVKEYQRIEKDPALNRRFQPIRVKEPSVEDTIKILYGLRPSLESFHNVTLEPDALRLTAELAARYIYDRFLPDKAIDLIDRAAAKEVIKITNVTEGSVISAVVNAALNVLGTLKAEAFRRGDMPSAFLFQEIEHAYRNFLLRWVENPLLIPEVNEPLQAITVSSPLKQEFFDMMRISILKRVDDILFASSNVRVDTKRRRLIKNLSPSKNEEIYTKVINNNINKKKSNDLSIYRISVFLYGEWLEGERLNFFTSISVKNQFFKELNHIIHESNIYDYLSNVRSLLFKNILSFSREKDFLEEDIESFEETIELLSELEEKRIEVFKDFARNFRPIIRKGIIDSLKCSSKITLTEKELVSVYALLGFYSTPTGQDFLENLEDPELIRLARNMGDFSGLKKRITHTEIRALLSHMTGIPMQSINSIETDKLLNLESTLHTRVIGQEEAISAIAKAIRRSRLGIQNPTRPIASFLFCGPTGVGKTEVTKALAVSLFGAESDMIRFDMSEFMEKFTVSRLIGSPPGYVGYDEGGQLTDSVRRKPYSVVLFDEVEKAHPDILNILLQILEDGRLTDSQKRLVPFENTVIIMTSNAAAEEIQQIIKDQRTSNIIESQSEKYPSKNKKDKPELSSSFHDEYSGAIDFLNSPIQENFLSDLKGQINVEFERSFRASTAYTRLERQLKESKEGIKDNNEEHSEKQKNQVTLKSAVLERLSTMFLPEFLNRLDDIIIFQPLSPEELRKICDIMIKEVIERVQSKRINLEVDDKVRLKLTREGYNPIFGARPLRRLVTKYIEDLISESLLKNPPVNKSQTVKIILDENDQITLKLEKESNISIAII